MEASFGALRVFDERGREVQQGKPFRPGGSSSRVAVKLRPGLRPGGFTATYRVVSADSHPVSGGFVFTVGDAGAPARTVDELLRGSDAGPVTSTAFAVVRAVQYGAIAIALGALVFLLWAWQPARANRLGCRLRGVLARPAAAAAGRERRGAAERARRARAPGRDGRRHERVGGARPRHARRGARDALRRSLGRRRAGVGRHLIGALAVPPGAALLPPLLALALLPALGGHASVQPPVALNAPANVLHVLAVSAWLGGVAVLVLVLRGATRELEPAERTRALATTVGRFSALAGGAIALLLATGVLQAVIGMSAFGELLDTPYGRAVLVKLGLLAAIVGLGWVNRRRSLPRLRRAAAGGVSPGAAGVLLRRTLRAEAALALAVLGATGALAGYPPAETVASGPFATDARSARRGSRSPSSPRASAPTSCTSTCSTAPTAASTTRRRSSPSPPRCPASGSRRSSCRRAGQARATTSSRAPRSASPATGGSRSPRASASSTSTAPASRSPSDDPQEDSR